MLFFKKEYSERNIQFFLTENLKYNKIKNLIKGSKVEEKKKLNHTFNMLTSPRKKEK